MTMASLAQETEIAAAHSARRRAMHRSLDILAAVGILAVASPLALAIVALIKLDGGPLLVGTPCRSPGGRTLIRWRFRTTRIGSRSFPRLVNQWGCWKFCTPKPADRLTAIGRLLTLFRLDEFPRIVNLLNGSESLFGSD
ncbi:MAG: hypothetical protein GC191_11255 [Azospirillum sp.]|nr:hypothetical protein [Azospirillum sp.]